MKIMENKNPMTVKRMKSGTINRDRKYLKHPRGRSVDMRNIAFRITRHKIPSPREDSAATQNAHEKCLG
jgi:hypothetical protein